MTEKPKSSSTDIWWTLGFVFACVVLVNRLLTAMKIVDAQTVTGGIVIGLVGALVGIILKRITTSLPFVQRIAIIVALIVVAFFIK